MIRPNACTEFQVRSRRTADVEDPLQHNTGGRVETNEHRAPGSRLDGLPAHRPVMQAGTDGWGQWLLDTFSTVAAEEEDRAPLPTLIRRIEFGRPSQWPALAADLRRNLGITQENARWSAEEVLAMLRGPDWCGEIVSGRLDLASLVQAVGNMPEPDRTTESTLAAAVDLAVTQRQRQRHGSEIEAPGSAAPHRAAHENDALQTTVAEVLKTPAGQISVANITRLFSKVGSCVQTEVIALALANHFNQLTDGVRLHRTSRVAFMPRLIETLLARGLIGVEHAQLARDAAARAGQYARLSQPREPFTAGLTHMATDQAMLCRLMHDPVECTRLIGAQLHNFGVMPKGYFPQLLQNLLDTTHKLETKGFIQPLTAALLRQRLPFVVEACYYRNCRLHGVPPANLALPGTSAEGMFDAAAAMQWWRGEALEHLRDALTDFHARGSLEVEGVGLMERYGDVLGRMLCDPEKISAVLAHLNQQLSH